MAGLTVLFATRNRASTLERVLETYCALESPADGWKLVVVDNGSTDRTRAVVESFQARLPLIYLFESTAGKNIALNRGLSHITGDLVVLTDDDAFPRADWLTELRRAADANPDAGVFGGAICPRWEVPPPPDLLNHVPLAWTYTVSDPHLVAGYIDGRQVFGPNMAVRAAVFEAGHRFDVSVGPNGSRSYTMGSETEFVLRVMSSGVRAWFVPTAVVEHDVPRAHLRRSWIVGRMTRAGRCDCRLYLLYPQSSQWFWGFTEAPAMSPRVAGIPVAVCYRVARQTAVLIHQLLRLRRDRAFQELWILGYLSGFAGEARRCLRHQ